MTTTSLFTPSRRRVLQGMGAGLVTAALPGHVFGQAAPLKVGFQLHRTGIGAAYGRWYERTATAAAGVINAAGGIGGRPVELVFEDDATDPKRGAEVVEKLAGPGGCDLIMGTLFSHVVMGSAPRAGELKIPYLVCSEGYHVASGALNRWTLQPGITDVRAQISTMAPWVSANLGKKVTMVFPDYAFGHDHRDFFTAAIAAQGGEVIAQIAVPPTETSFTRYFPQIPAETEVLYHVMVGPAVLTFVKELGEFYGTGAKPQLFGFIDSLEAVDTATRGWSSWKARTSGRATAASSPPTRARPKPPIAPRWAWTTTAPRSATRPMWRPMPTCSRAGRRCISSSRRSRHRATPGRPTARSWSRRWRR